MIIGAMEEVITLLIITDIIILHITTDIAIII